MHNEYIHFPVLTKCKILCNKKKAVYNSDIGLTVKTGSISCKVNEWKQTGPWHSRSIRKPQPPSKKPSREANLSAQPLGTAFSIKGSCKGSTSTLQTRLFWATPVSQS